MVRENKLKTNIIDFVKSYPNVLERDVCSLIVEELKDLEPDEKISGSTRVNGLTCTSVHAEEDNMTWPLLADAIRKTKIKYIDEYPKYEKFINANSGEMYDVFEDISGKLLIQHYPENGYMREHTDHSSQRNYIKTNKTIDLEYHHAQLSIIIMLNDDYDGGEFVVSEKSFKGETGTAIVFPSGFMYPHKVEQVKNGERWSCAAWLR